MHWCSAVSSEDGPIGLGSTVRSEVLHWAAARTLTTVDDDHAVGKLDLEARHGAADAESDLIPVVKSGEVSWADLAGREEGDDRSVAELAGTWFSEPCYSLAKLIEHDRGCRPFPGCGASDGSDVLLDVGVVCW